MTLGWLLVLAVCVGSLVPGQTLPTFSISDKVLHAGSYFLLMVWFAGLYGRKHQAWIALALVLLGIALDIAQTGDCYTLLRGPRYPRERRRRFGRSSLVALASRRLVPATGAPRFWHMIAGGRARPLDPSRPRITLRTC